MYKIFLYFLSSLLIMIDNLIISGLVPKIVKFSFELINENFKLFLQLIFLFLVNFYIPSYCELFC